MIMGAPVVSGWVGHLDTNDSEDHSPTRASLVAQPKTGTFWGLGHHLGCDTWPRLGLRSSRPSSNLCNKPSILKKTVEGGMGQSVD